MKRITRMETKFLMFIVVVLSQACSVLQLSADSIPSDLNNKFRKLGGTSQEAHFISQPWYSAILPGNFIITGNYLYHKNAVPDELAFSTLTEGGRRGDRWRVYLDKQACSGLVKNAAAKQLVETAFDRSLDAFSALRPMAYRQALDVELYLVGSRTNLEKYISRHAMHAVPVSIVAPVCDYGGGDDGRFEDAFLDAVSDLFHESVHAYLNVYGAGAGDDRRNAYYEEALANTVGVAVMASASAAMRAARERHKARQHTLGDGQDCLSVNINYTSPKEIAHTIRQSNSERLAATSGEHPNWVEAALFGYRVGWIGAMQALNKGGVSLRYNGTWWCLHPRDEKQNRILLEFARKLWQNKKDMPRIFSRILQQAEAQSSV